MTPKIIFKYWHIPDNTDWTKQSDQTGPAQTELLNLQTDLLPKGNESLYHEKNYFNIDLY